MYRIVDGDDARVEAKFTAVLSELQRLVHGDAGMRLAATRDARHEAVEAGGVHGGARPG